MIRDIPPQKWTSVLEQFGREHRAWLATLHAVERGTDVTRAVELPLKSATAADGIVELDFLGHWPSLRARRPSVVRLQLTDAGAVLALEIDTSDGRFIRLAFRATALPEQVDGLAPGERLELAAIR